MRREQHFTVSTAQINEDLARWRKRQMKKGYDKSRPGYTDDNWLHLVFTKKALRFILEQCIVST